MFNQQSKDKYSNWGASSSFGARGNGMSKPPTISKPGAGNFFPYKESSTDSRGEKLTSGKSFNLFGNSSDQKKPDLWSQVSMKESLFYPLGKSQTSTTNEDIIFGLPGGTRIHESNDLNDKQNFSGSKPPPRNLTVHKGNGIPNFPVEGSNQSSSTSIIIPYNNNNNSAPPRSRLGKLFSYFKRDAKEKSKAHTVFKASHVTPNTLANPSYKAIDTRRIGSMRRLVLKTKPVKFHSIDVNKVLGSKRGVDVSTNISANKLLAPELNNENAIDEVEEEVEYRPFTADVTEKNANSGAGANSSAEEKQDKSETTVKQYNGYWTYPSVDELSQMDSSNLENVQDFIIGRVGYGQIAYDYPVDLTNIVSNADGNGTSIAEELFDNIVTIKQSAVLVYKDNEEKPPLGNELNVPATITLEGIKPKPNVSMKDHINYLKSQIGMEFVTYDPITYVWVFKVKHFSVWGLIDEDDHNQKDLVRLKRKQDLKEAEASAEYSKVYSNTCLDQEVKKQKLNEYSKGVPGGWGSAFQSEDSLLNLKRSYVTDEIAEVLNRYRDVEDDNIVNEVGGITIDSETEGVEEIDDIKVNAYEPVITDVSVFDQIRNKSTFPTTDNWLLQLELANQYNSAMAPMAPERDFPKGELNISKVDEILFASAKRGKNRGLNGSKKTKIPLKDVSESEIKFVVDRLIRNCEFTKSSNLMPSLEPRGLTFATFFDKSENSVLNLQIELASILLDSSDDVDSKKLISFGEWLQKYNETQIKELLETHQSDDMYCIFLHLCGNQRDDAIKRALGSNNLHLAAILSVQDSQDGLLKELCAEQLETWQKPSWEDSIPNYLFKIHQLLSGQIAHIEESLPWSVVMGIHLYYGNVVSVNGLINESISTLPEEDPTADLFRLYVRGVNYTSVSSSKVSGVLKWLLCLVLGDLSDDGLSVGLGDSLENAGLWKEALVVYCSIKNENSKLELIRNVIMTKTEEKSIDEHDEKYLTTVLRIPKSQILEARALERQSAGDYWSEVDAFMEVGLWSKAHETIVVRLGPQTVIKNCATDTAKLLEIIGQFPKHGSIIPSWNEGAGIYQNYLKLISNNEDTEVIVFLLGALAAVKPQTTEQKLAINIIAKFVGDLALENRRVPHSQMQKLLGSPLDEVNKAYFKLRLS
ncbi:NUP145 [Candida theae]|uniref:NUP145 n=1 Tax=Candida theae TaxID=1198502 RepID=A0AAD5FYN4_9ASCO|nr:NUP145 [Candida theae]KAI5958552.1 NUP145 [Candida theae]